MNEMNEILFLASVPALLGSVWLFFLWKKARQRRKERDQKFQRILDEISNRHKEEEQMWGGG